MHASELILGDLQKLDPETRAEIRRVAGADLGGSSVAGADRSLPAVGMRPIAPSRTVSRPAATMPVGSAKPAADWPTTRSQLASGLARPGRLGTMPSHEGPSR
jgi:hypothetical protein